MAQVIDEIPIATEQRQDLLIDLRRLETVLYQADQICWRSGPVRVHPHVDVARHIVRRLICVLEGKVRS